MRVASRKTVENGDDETTNESLQQQQQQKERMEQATSVCYTCLLLQRIGDRRQQPFSDSD